MSEKDRVQGMLGAAKRWEVVKPKMVVAGSSAQAENVLADAIHDIGALWRACTNAADEITRLNRELADARNAALEEAAVRADSKCSYIRTNEMYPAYGLNSQAEALESIAAAIRQMKEKAE